MVSSAALRRSLQPITPQQEVYCPLQLAEAEVKADALVRTKWLAGQDVMQHDAPAKPAERPDTIAQDPQTPERGRASVEPHRFGYGAGLAETALQPAEIRYRHAGAGNEVVGDHRRVVPELVAGVADAEHDLGVLTRGQAVAAAAGEGHRFEPAAIGHRLALYDQAGPDQVGDLTVRQNRARRVAVVLLGITGAMAGDNVVGLDFLFEGGEVLST